MYNDTFAFTNVNFHVCLLNICVILFVISYYYLFNTVCNILIFMIVNSCTTTLLYDECKPYGLGTIKNMNMNEYEYTRLDRISQYINIKFNVNYYRLIRS